MDAAAIILARGGSKGIPGKNLTRIGDNSLLGWAIEACHRASLVSATYVSTEDGAIAKEAEVYGASVIWRPEELATDTADGADALRHAAKHIHDRHDIIACVECTCFPCYGKNIDGTIRAVEYFHAGSACTVKRECVFLWAERPDGFAYPLFRNWKNRQELPAEYKLTGECFAARRDAFERTGEILTGGIVLVKVEENQVDIDEPFDLDIARLLYQRLGK
jgi:N-acylneuraminate cytidylyltransferase